MNRLTRRIVTGKADCAYCTGEYMTKRGCSNRCELRIAQKERLTAYEDLNLTPSEISASLAELETLRIKDKTAKYRVYKKRCGELEKALAAKESINQLYKATTGIIGSDKAEAIHRMEKAEAELETLKRQIADGELVNVVRCDECREWTLKASYGGGLENKGICNLLSGGGCAFKTIPDGADVITSECFGCNHGERRNQNEND